MNIKKGGRGGPPGGQGTQEGWRISLPRDILLSGQPLCHFWTPGRIQWLAGRRTLQGHRVTQGHRHRFMLGGARCLSCRPSCYWVSGVYMSIRPAAVRMCTYRTFLHSTFHWHLSLAPLGTIFQMVPVPDSDSLADGSGPGLSERGQTGDQPSLPSWDWVPPPASSPAPLPAVSTG